MVGLRLSFKNSGLDLDRKIWQLEMAQAASGPEFGRAAEVERAGS